MNDKEIIDKWLESHDTGELCDYCINNGECPKAMVCYGGEPIEPYCARLEYEDYLDMESLLADIEDEEDEEGGTDGK